MSSAISHEPSLSFRANLANLVSPLRRVRSRSPFFRLAAHRIPVLWTLYRGLLRNSPTEEIKFRIRLLFRQNKHLTGIDKTRSRLFRGYKYLEFFRKGTEGDVHCQNVMMRYSRLIAAKRRKARLMRLVHEELDWQVERRNQPMLTGSYIRPTLYNVPLPRMKPQPQVTSLIFMKRKFAHQRRYDKKLALEEDLNDLRIEEELENNLQKLLPFQRVYSRPFAYDWSLSSFLLSEVTSRRDGILFTGEPIINAIEYIKESERREYARASTPYSSELIKAVTEARREKIRNKQRERERERGGEILKRTLKRQRSEAPGHIRSRWTAERRDMDRVVRSVSEVGYVALVKRRLGVKLRDPDAGLELGEIENREMLTRATEFLRAVNERKNKAEEDFINNAKRSR